MPTEGAPDGRIYPAAVWTGSEVFIWGGFGIPPDGPQALNSGGAYNPTTRIWRTLSPGPAAIEAPSAVWTGTHVFLWGRPGWGPFEGWLYHPPTDAWKKVSTVGLPQDPPQFRGPLWTGSEVVVGPGKHYDPATDTWSITTPTGAWPPATGGEGVWTGTEVVYWGGSISAAGGRYRPKPLVTVQDIRVTEGSSGPSDRMVPIQISHASTDPVSVQVIAASLSADAGADFEADEQTIVFAPGETTKDFRLTVIGDSVPEPNETLRLTVQDVEGAIRQKTIANITIEDDEALPALSVASAVTLEGFSGFTTGQVRAKLSRVHSEPVTFRVTTAEGTATNSDFTGANMTVTIPSGVSEVTVPVSVIGDTLVEPNESFSFLVSDVQGAVLDSVPEQRVDILNDDGPTISVGDFSIAEGTGAGTTNLSFTVITSQTSTAPITVHYASANGTASSVNDYTAVSGMATLAPGIASVVVQVPVTRDAARESDETLFLNLSNATNATILDAQGKGTIVGDDDLLVSLADKTTAEGDTGTTAMNFTVSLSAPASATVTVDFATADGSATAPLDYATVSGTVTFAPGETSKSVAVSVVGETLEETSERFSVDLSNPTGGSTIGRGQAQGTITNTDGSTDRSRLMFHNSQTNRLYRWHMKNGNTLDTFNWVTPWATDPGWTVGAVADFDQDGQLDYLWRNVSDGRMLFWYFDGDNLKGFQFLPYLMGPPWKVATTFDADGNRTQDIVFYNESTGVLKVKRHDNGLVLGEYDLSQTLPPSGTIRVVNAVDANNDGDDELVRYNSATGAVSAWDVSGAAVGATISYANTQDTTLAFNLVSTKTDFNDDGAPDFLWHNPTPTGVFSVWFMNQTTRLGVGGFFPFSNTDPAWRVVGSANVW